jgi:hypothetical protein
MWRVVGVEVHGRKSIQRGKGWQVKINSPIWQQLIRIQRKTSTTSIN